MGSNVSGLGKYSGSRDMAAVGIQTMVWAGTGIGSDLLLSMGFEGRGVALKVCGCIIFRMTDAEGSSCVSNYH